MATVSSAVGTNQEIARLAGPNTRRIDLGGRSVVPGLIDNHAHYMEEGVLWTVELRLDGIETRKQATEMVRAKANSLPPGQWVYTLGGWSPDQFTDDKRPFTREELDKIAPNHPVLLQFTRAETYLNSRAIEAIGLEKMTDPWIRRDANGRSTGVVDAAGAGRVSSAIPPPSEGCGRAEQPRHDPGTERVGADRIGRHVPGRIRAHLPRHGARRDG